MYSLATLLLLVIISSFPSCVKTPQRLYLIWINLKTLNRHAVVRD